VSWTLAGAFDAGHIRGGTPGWERELDFHQLELSGHDQQLEADYRLFREEFGLTMFRDGAWLRKTCPQEGQYDWTHLDRLASVSQGQVYLSLCHYEWLPWIEEDDVWNGKVIDAMQAFAFEVAKRYRGHFAGYLPVVEIGYWTAMMTDWARWWPSKHGKAASSWWRMYGVTGKMMVEMAKAVREADPMATIALSEPWAWHPDMPLEDQGRPFNTLLGRPDPVAERECGGEHWGGNSSLLQMVGLNFYNNWGVDAGWPLSRLLLEARHQYPNQRIVMGETGNCHFSHCHTVEAWLDLIGQEVDLANSQGANVEAVTWAPILTLGDFDWGTPAPGAWVTWSPEDASRKRHWDPAVAKAVRRKTSAVKGAFLS
jgi:hypothetical protein